MFRATRLLNQKTFGNPEAEDLERKLVTRPEDILEIVSKYLKDQFMDSDQDVTPRRAQEVRKSFNSLSNNKAPGEDNINGELLKYRTPLLDKTIADKYNTSSKKHADL